MKDSNVNYNMSTRKFKQEPLLISIILKGANIGAMSQN